MSLSLQDMKEIRQDFSLIQKSYLGCYTELVEKIHRMEVDHQRGLHQYELMIQKEKTRGDLLEKELIIKQGLLENEKLKRQLLEYQIKHIK